MKTNNLDISFIHQGDLVFIVNWEKPGKTGWWRKTKITHDDSKSELFLEKPVHKDYDYSQLVQSKSRAEYGVFVMKPSTVDYDCNKYEIMFVATGVASAKIVNSGYKIDHLLFHAPAFKDMFYYTDRGLELFKAWNTSDEDPKSVLELARELIK